MDEKEREIAEQAAVLIMQEYGRALHANGNFHSLHEGYGVLEEEREELFDEIKLKPHKRDAHCLVHEAMQVAAVAMRIMVFVMMQEQERRTSI